MLYSRFLLVTYFIHSSVYLGLPRLGLVVKNTPVNAGETCVLSLGQEAPLVGVLAAHTSVLAWRIPGTEDTGGLQSRVAKSLT